MENKRLILSIIGLVVAIPLVANSGEPPRGRHQITQKQIAEAAEDAIARNFNARKCSEKLYRGHSRDSLGYCALWLYDAQSFPEAVAAKSFYDLALDRIEEEAKGIKR